jgi:hypothetical protein
MLVVVILAIAFGVFVGLVLLRQPVLRGSSPRWLRPFYLWIFPPDDLFVRTELKVVNLEKQGNIDFEFSPKYVGEYEIGVIAERKIEMPKKSYNFGFAGTILAYSGEKKCWSRNVGPNPLPWWDISSNGFALSTFSVPRDIPLDLATRFTFQVNTGSSSFSRDYGSATIYIGKKAEK